MLIVLSFAFFSQDLQHPNEFVRGSTLRFLCKLKEAEIIEPLIPAIQECLNHRHSYVCTCEQLHDEMRCFFLLPFSTVLCRVLTNCFCLVQVRRNAVMTIFTIFKNFEHLIPDAPEIIQRFLENEPVRRSLTTVDSV